MRILEALGVIAGASILVTYMFSRSIKNQTRRVGMRQVSRTAVYEKNEKPPFIMLASLGNPEKSYRGTRHSVGHMVLQQVAQQLGFDEQYTIGKSRYLASGYRPEMVLYESSSYMNNSGKNIRDAWTDLVNSARVVEYNPVLVVLHDELDLALGKIKVKKQHSSHRGHNGLKSVQAHLGRGYIAIAVGISRPASKDPRHVADYVLGRFSSSELVTIQDQAVPAVVDVLQEMVSAERYIYDVNRGK